MIVYKGINNVTGEWVYGDIFPHGEQRFILMLNGYVSEVIPDSVAICSEEEYKILNINT